MGFNIFTAAEAASLVQDGDTIGLSGFTPAGVPKSIPAEIAKKAEAEHLPYHITDEKIQGSIQTRADINPTSFLK